MSRSRTEAVGAGLALIAILFAALNLRAGIASLGPVLSDVLEWFGASGTFAGFITAMPGLFFAIMGLAAVPLARRVGLSRALLLGMVATTIGLGLRPWVGNIWLFIVLTALVVAGIALSNVLLPAWIKLHGGSRVVALMTVNSAVLGLSGTLGPLSAALADRPGGWRDALFVWVWLSVAQVVVWIVVAVRTGYDFPRPTAEVAEPTAAAATSRAQQETAPTGSLWRSPSAVFLMMYFGLQSMQAYIQMGWLPQMLLDAGAARSTASWALSVTMLCGIFGGLAIPTIIARSKHVPWYPVAFGALTIAGYLGILLAPTAAPILWAFLLGMGGWAFPTALNLIVAKSHHPLVAARLSGFVQPFGYFVAAAGPFLVGVAYSPEGGWTGILIALMIAAAVKGLVGYRAGQPGYVDDELKA